jgi:hypothetical protein
MNPSDKHVPDGPSWRGVVGQKVALVPGAAHGSGGSADPPFVAVTMRKRSWEGVPGIQGSFAPPGRAETGTFSTGEAQRNPWLQSVTTPGPRLDTM